LHQQSQQAVEKSLEFGPYRLSPDGTLQVPKGKVVNLTRRLARLLSELAMADGAAISRIDLLDRCWGDRSVNDESLSRAISDLRKVFRQAGTDPIQSVYGLGYRLSVKDAVPDIDATARRAASFCREAWHRLYQRRAASLESADHLFDLAAKDSPNDMQPWLGLAETQIHRMQLGYAPTIEAWPRARAALDRALTIDPSSADALALLGLGLTWIEWNFAEARENLNQALQTDPDGYIPNQALGWHNLSLGRLDPALKQFRRAIEIDPAAMPARGVLAVTLMYRGDSENALSSARELLRLDPGGGVSQGYASIIEATHGDPRSAVESGKRSLEQLPESPVVGSFLAYAMARAQQQGEARALLESLAKKNSEGSVSAMACPAWLELGNRERALAALEAAAAMRCPWLPMILHDPRIDSLRTEPLFKAIFKEIFGRLPQK